MTTVLATAPCGCKLMGGSWQSGHDSGGAATETRSLWIERPDGQTWHYVGLYDGHFEWAAQFFCSPAGDAWLAEREALWAAERALAAGTVRA